VIVQQRVELGTLPEAHVSRLVTARKEDRIRIAHHLQHLRIVGRFAVMEHQRLHCGDSADVVVELLLHVVVAGRTQDHHAAVAGTFNPPMECFRHPVTAPHQQHRRLRPRRARGLDVANFVVVIARSTAGRRGLHIGNTCNHQRHYGKHQPLPPGTLTFQHVNAHSSRRLIAVMPDFPTVVNRVKKVLDAVTLCTFQTGAAGISPHAGGKKSRTLFIRELIHA